MMPEGLLIAVALLFSAAVAAIGRRLPRPASVAASTTALATLVTVLLLSPALARWVDALLAVMGAGRLAFYVALMTQQCGFFLTVMLATHQWARRHGWVLGGAGVLTGCFVGLWLHVKTLALPDLTAVFYGPHAGSPPAVLWLHLVTGLGVVYMVVWGLRAFLRFLRGARSTDEQVVASVVIVVYGLTGLSGVCTIVEAVGHRLGMHIALVSQVKPVLKVVLSAGVMLFLIGQIWLWPLWRHRRQLLARYVEPELVQVRNDVLNLSAAMAALHLDVHHTAYANRAMVEAVAARGRAAGYSPARVAMARMATSLITFRRDNVLQDPGYGALISWEALMEEAVAEMDQAMARTAWARALHTSTIYQQVYILMFLVLDGRAYRDILLMDEHPRVQAWHQQLADLMATVMHQHGHATPRARTLAQRTAQRTGWRQRGAALAGRWLGALTPLRRAAPTAAGSRDSREPPH